MNSSTNHRRNNITHSGYTIIEIILGVIAVACIALAILPMFTYYTRINNAQALADQSIIVKSSLNIF